MTSLSPDSTQTQITKRKRSPWGSNTVICLYYIYTYSYDDIHVEIRGLSSVELDQMIGSGTFGLVFKG